MQDPLGWDYGDVDGTEQGWRLDGETPYSRGDATGSETPPSIARVAEIAQPIAEAPAATDSVATGAKKTTPRLHAAQCPVPVEAPPVAAVPMGEAEAAEETTDDGSGPESAEEPSDATAAPAGATE
ncbi:MAG: hypothetical protein GF320_11685 [Armatimonadia bacterium]|nr:hypothetical protein [Armatimonadia bacterium]